MKYSILFAPDSRGSVRMMVRYKMKRKFYNIGYVVDPLKWNKETQRCKRNTSHGEKHIPAAKINAEIQRYEDEVIHIASSYRKDPTVEEFHEKLDEAFGRKKEEANKEDGFKSVFTRFTLEEGEHSQWTPPMYTKMRTVIKHIMEYDKNVSFGKIDAMWMDGFCSYLLDLDFKSSYIKKLIETTKIFFNWAASHGYIHDMGYKGYRCKVKEVPKRVIFLTMDELLRVYHWDFGKKEYLARARDCFCFCCFSSLRYSDMANLKKDDIVDDMIYVTTQKTSDSLKIELNDYTKAILARYWDNGSEYALPAASNIKMNEFLKEIGKTCGLDTPITETFYRGGKRVDTVNPKWKLLTTHCGRRTFICNSLMMGIQPEIVMKWTGHSDYKQMKPYIDVTDREKKKSMSLFNQIESDRKM